jgi:hypothetical protein
VIEQKGSSLQNILVEDDELKSSVWMFNRPENLEPGDDFLVYLHLLFQRKWYRNLLMKGFHLVVLLAAGPGIRDTQVCSSVAILDFTFVAFLIPLMY